MDDPVAILNPELLFSVCSLKQNCTLSKKLVKSLTGNTKEGFILIKHGCLSVNEIKSPCNVTL